MSNIELIIAKPQMGLCNPKSSLYIPGADEDISNLNHMIKNMGHKIDNINILLDFHYSSRTKDQNIITKLHTVLKKWEKQYKKEINYILLSKQKIDDNNYMNQKCIDNCAHANYILIGGEEGNDCIIKIIKQLIELFNKNIINKIVLIRDAISSMKEYEQTQNSFIREMMQKGMVLRTTKDVF